MVFFTLEQRIVWLCGICYAKYPTQGEAKDCEARGEPRFRFGGETEEEKRVMLVKMSFEEKTSIRIVKIKAEIVERIIGPKHYPRYLIKLETGEMVERGEGVLVPA